MNEAIPEVPAEITDAFDLGSVLGQHHTLALLAGRCSAAQAASLKCLRDEKKYLRLAPTWEEFCNRFLRISRSQAEQIIHLWEEFGAGYFEVAQLTRISPQTYRAIAPSIQNGALQTSGGAIELSVENSRKIAAAVAELRQAARPKPRPGGLPMHERLNALDKRCVKIVAEFAEISAKERSGENWLHFASLLQRTVQGLRRIEVENNLA